MFSSLNRLFSSNNARTALVKKNIGATFVLRGISIAASFLLVPMTIGYVSSELYGVWLTLSSMIQWLSFFDVGFGNGLRNKLATALALKKYDQGKIYVSTAYFTLGLIFLAVGCVAWFFIPIVNWANLLNVSHELESTLITVVRIVLIAFVVQMVIKIIQNVCQAYQLQSLSSAIDAFSNVLTMVVIFVLTKTTFPSLQNIAVAFSLCPIILLVGFSLYLYLTKFNKVAPSMACVKASYAKDIFSLGGKFFLIQIATIAYFQSTNFIISYVCGAEKVSIYNVAYKYLHIALMIFSIVLAPVWSAITDAYAKKDFPWMNRLYKKLCKVYIFCALGIVCLVMISPFIYKIWLGDKIQVPIDITIALSLYMIVSAYSQMLVSIINGVGKVKIQMWVSVLVPLVYLPMSFTMGRLLGVLGIICALIVTALPNTVLAYIQVKKVLAQNAKGVWNA